LSRPTTRSSSWQWICSRSWAWTQQQETSHDEAARRTAGLAVILCLGARQNAEGVPLGRTPAAMLRSKSDVAKGGGSGADRGPGAGCRWAVFAHLATSSAPGSAPHPKPTMEVGVRDMVLVGDHEVGEGSPNTPEAASLGRVRQRPS
jgi:hypothetical protein